MSPTADTVGSVVYLLAEILGCIAIGAILSAYYSGLVDPPAAPETPRDEKGGE